MPGPRAAAGQGGCQHHRWVGGWVGQQRQRPFWAGTHQCAAPAARQLGAVQSMGFGARGRQRLSTAPASSLPLPPPPPPPPSLAPCCRRCLPSATDSLPPAHRRCLLRRCGRHVCQHVQRAVRGRPAHRCSTGGDLAGRCLGQLDSVESLHLSASGRVQDSWAQGNVEDMGTEVLLAKKQCCFSECMHAFPLRRSAAGMCPSTWTQPMVA